MKKICEDNKFLCTLGLAMKAGALRTGANLCEEDIRHGNAKIAFLSSDASGNTVKQIVNACSSYGVDVIMLSSTKEALAKRLGKSGYISCIVVKDNGFAKLMTNKTENIAAEND